jgi:hypothetical protein
MSDFGATDQFSLHRLARPFTTSALLPISRRRPITFFRQTPILFRIKMSQPILFFSKQERKQGRYRPTKHVALFCFFEDKDEFVDAVDLVLDILDQRPESVRDIVDEGI